MASTTPVASLTDAKLRGAGTTVDFTTAVARVSMVVIVTGEVTDGVVAMEASQDGTNWVKVEGVAPSTGFNQYAQPARGAFRYWRAHILADITGGGSVTATFMEAS